MLTVENKLKYLESLTYEIFLQGRTFTYETSGSFLIWELLNKQDSCTKSQYSTSSGDWLSSGDTSAFDFLLKHLHR